MITNIDTIGYEYLILITNDLPQPIKNEQQSIHDKGIVHSSSEKIHINKEEEKQIDQNKEKQQKQQQQKEEEKNDSDERTDWLSLKDDSSGKIFYYKDGEYVWKVLSS